MLKVSPGIPLAVSMIVAACPAALGQVDDGARIHEAAIVFDAHSDFLDRAAADGSDLAADPEHAHTTLAKLEAGGVDAQVFVAFAPPAYRDYGFANRTYELIDRLHREIEKNVDRIALARTAADVRRIAADGKIAALLAIEGGHSIENQLEHLRNFHRLGLRSMTLTWSNSNDWADAAGDVARWSGLSDFGVDVVAEMNRLGVVIDISHVSEDTFWDVIRSSRSPVIASHSGVRALLDDERNLSDAMIVALAEAGGVVNVTFYGVHLDAEFAARVDEALDRAAAEFKQLGARYLHDPVALDTAEWGLEKQIERSVPAPPLSVVADHIDHIVGLVGADHVGLGSDFDGMGTVPRGLEHAGMMPALTAELVRRGYGETDIAKILGENLLRVLAVNERLAGE